MSAIGFPVRCLVELFHDFLHAPMKRKSFFQPHSNSDNPLGRRSPGRLTFPSPSSRSSRDQLFVFALKISALAAKTNSASTL
jgi:hypothetical protein